MDLSILSEDGQTVKESFVVSYQTPRDLVAYDKATKTIALGDVSAMLTLYGDTDTPLSVQQLDRKQPMSVMKPSKSRSIFGATRNNVHHQQLGTLHCLHQFVFAQPYDKRSSVRTGGFIEGEHLGQRETAIILSTLSPALIAA
jgi:hypothetical protein